MRARGAHERPRDLVLKQRYAEATGSMLSLLFGFSLLIPVLLLVFVIFAGRPDDLPLADWAGWKSALSAFWEHPQASEAFFDAVFFLVVALPVLFAVSVVIPKQRLIVSGDTLRWHLPVPDWLEFVKRGWTLSLREVTRARLKRPPFAPEAAVTLEIEVGGKTRVLQPMLWVEESAAAEKLPFFGSVAALASRPDCTRVLETPLCAALIDAGVVIEGLEDDRSPGRGLNFDLTTNDAARIVAVLIIALACYGVLDTMFAPESYVTGPPLRWLAAVGCFAAAFVFVYLANNEVPTLVTVVLCAFLGLSSAAASWPGILRVNALTDTRGLQTVTYGKAMGNRFEPLDPTAGWPPVSMPEPAYWALQPEAIERSIRIRRGGLGIYQVRLDNIREELREYFRSR